MDSQDRDETKIRRGQASLARRVGEALDQMTPHGTRECPDAEIIAAYAEQALGPAESAEWEGHFAACARCRNILRVLAASAETPLAEKEVAQLGKLVSTVRAPVEIAGRSGWRARPRLLDWRTRWLAPALGVAAVLAVWFAMRPPWRATDRGASATLVAQAPREEAPLSPAPTERDRILQVVPQPDQKTQPTPPPDRSSSIAPTNSPVEGRAKGSADAANALDRISPSVSEATSSLKKEKDLSALPGRRELQPPALPEVQAATGAPAAPQSETKAAFGAPAPAPSPQARAQGNEAVPQAPGVPQSTSQSVTVAESAPQAETTSGALGGTLQQKSSADRPSNGRNFKALATVRPAGEYSALLKAPSGSALWRAGKGGIIERSTDAGKTWAAQASPSQEDWLAGAAVSDTVCWLAGRNGAIARTVDGERWQRVAPPAQAASTAGKSADWTGITTRDAQSAVITATDGRKFATADGGKTWQPQ
jgi:photosystem II stability/assembly factor-like uncharacterized protein